MGLLATETKATICGIKERANQDKAGTNSAG